jgi:hypothetical protein
MVYVADRWRDETELDGINLISSADIWFYSLFAYIFFLDKLNTSSEPRFCGVICVSLQISQSAYLF